MQISIKGSVNNQVKAGEVIAITITHPDGNPETITATTDESGQFSSTIEEVPGTGYNGKAHIDADDEYQAADSPVVNFDVSKQTRTLVLQVG